MLKVAGLIVGHAYESHDVDVIDSSADAGGFLKKHRHMWNSCDKTLIVALAS